MADPEKLVVTCLFTDIEGSTLIVKTLRDDYARALQEHRELIRQAIAAHGGKEMDTYGDSFFVVFKPPKQAVLCAVYAQRALASHRWPGGVRLQVRMGIHTGEVQRVGDTYLGLTVHRASRICDAAHGGQVLISRATQEIIEDEEENDLGIQFLDLGELHLKDFNRPVQLFQLAAPGLKRHFPVLQPPPKPPIHRISTDWSLWLARLNTYMGGEVEVKRVLQHEPEVVIEGVLSLSRRQSDFAANERPALKFNRGVAVLASTPLWDTEPVVLRVWETDYASVRALDQSGARPTMISANVLLVCGETEEIILHRRSPFVSRNYPHALHTFGGIYWPPEAGARGFDSLIKTAQREVAEESGIVIDLLPLPPLLLGAEPKIGFVHIALLGVNVSRATVSAAFTNIEGSIAIVKFSDLRDRLSSDAWVPAGKAQILSWLALGAPLGHERMKFGGHTGEEVFNQIVP